MDEKSATVSPVATTITPATTLPTHLRSVIDLDTTLSLHLHTFCKPYVPRPILQTLEISGDGRFFFPLTLALIFSPPLLLLRPFFISFLLGLLLDIAIVGVLKHIIRRPRPVYNKGMSLIVSVDHWSFPSGHSSRVWFVASFLYLSSKELAASLVKLWADRSAAAVEFADERERLFVLVVCVWATMTSISRVLLGRHFVFDVIAGACFGVFEGFQADRAGNLICDDKGMDHPRKGHYYCHKESKPGQEEK